jgi:hypothetical protein
MIGKFEPDLIEKKARGKLLFDNPRLSYTRPNGYTDIEWLSHMYYMKKGFSSVIRNRLAPQKVLDSCLDKFKNKSVLTKSDYEFVTKIINEYV